jgi:putative endopeptidase
MDTTADPRQDFRRYAGGLWLDAAKIPADQLEISGYLVMQEAVQDQLRDLLQQAARTSGAAAKGSPAQQVGDFYASGMDVARLSSLGVQPLVPAFERIAKLQGPTALAEELARLQLITGDSVILAGLVSPHPQDRSRMTIYVGDADLGLGTDNYLRPDAQRIRDGYVAKIADTLVIAGWNPEAARATAQMVLAVETRVAKKKLTPLEKRDPAKRFVAMPYTDAKRLLSNIDLDAFFRSLRLPTGGEVIVVGVEALRERNAILAEYSPEQTRAYVQYELLRRMAPYLTPAFDRPDAAFSVVLYGKDVTPPRDKQVAEATPGLLGHPLSRLYVAKYMTPESRREVEAMVARVKAQFRARIERNGWLSPETRAQALAKLDKTEIRVGYPPKWIDYAGVDVRRDDYAGNAMRLNEFLVRRELTKLGKPVELDQFAVPKQTLPIVINAGDRMWLDPNDRVRIW